MIKLIQAIRDRANGSRANLLSDVVTKLDRLVRSAPLLEPQTGVFDRPARQSNTGPRLAIEDRGLQKLC